MASSGTLEVIVYQLTNRVNGKRYIGVTRRGLAIRMSQHFCCNSPSTRGDKQPLKCAIRKYGRAAFVAEVREVHASYSEALKAERRLIAAERPEYNATAGGEGVLGYKPSHETVEKIIASRRRNGTLGGRLGIKRPGSGLKGHATKLERGTVARPWLGKSRDEATKAKISASKRGKPRPPLPEEVVDIFRDNMRRAAAARRRQVICAETGAAYLSAEAASVALGASRTSVASAIRRGLRLYGLTFRYGGP